MPGVKHKLNSAKSVTATDFSILTFDYDATGPGLGRVTATIQLFDAANNIITDTQIPVQASGPITPAQLAMLETGIINYLVSVGLVTVPPTTP